MGLGPPTSLLIHEHLGLLGAGAEGRGARKLSPAAPAAVIEALLDGPAAQ